MKRLLILVAMALAACTAPPRGAETDLARWQQQARAVTITRDDWGIPHVHGRTDADAVFGVVYAQAEDDFNRIETNYLTMIGRLAEAEGESALYGDLRARLYVDPAEMKRRYAASPAWLKALMDAWADALNYYLHEHPQVKPRVITRFEPWMPLSFSEGSIGGDIERISVDGLRAFYGGEAPPAPVDPGAAREPDGSNGIAIAPSLSASGHALLWINPHTSFFFRAEAQVTSDEGLNAYGAMTWGQFFVYQGFNERLGWMHTSSNADNIDEYLESVRRRDGGYIYRYGAEERPLTAKEITLSYRTAGGMAQRTFTVYRSHHGPVVRAVDGRWVSVRLMDEPVKALMQSWLRTKARDIASFREALELHTNSSNNTVYADADGNIAYFHANFVPRRDPRFDWNRPVDGSDPATEWQGVHGFDESPNTINPPGGWVFNTNNWPYTAAGAGTLQKEDYPRYMDTGGENARGIHAMRVLEDAPPFTLDTLRDAAFDPGSPPSPTWFPRWSMPGTTRRPGTHSRRASRSRWRCCARGTIAGRRRPCRRRWRCTGARPCGSRTAPIPTARTPGLTSRSSPAPRRGKSSRRSPPRATGSPRTSARGPCHGAMSTASSASRVTSSSPSTTRRRAFPCRSRHRAGDRSPPSATAIAPSGKRRSSTARAATASSLPSSSASACARRQSRPAARAATPPQPTSTTRPPATPAGRCATCTSIATSSQDTSNANITLESDCNGV